MKAIYDIGWSDVIRVMKNKAYKMFADGHPNIVGIRNAKRKSNSYDDKCLAWWWNEDGGFVVHDYTITTNPGYHYLQNPIAGTKGTAILVPGQYINCWELGLHRGKQFALVQRGEMAVYRDDNKDTVLDYNPATIQKGYFGIDGHFGSLGDTDIVDRYSAGCQVWRYHEPHQDLMNDFKALSARLNFSKFTYTLLQQEDFS